MSTTALSKTPTAQSVVVNVVQSRAKFEAKRYLPHLANGRLRFNSAGDLVADDSPENFLVKVAAYLAVSGDRIALNTTAEALTVTMPASPSAGDRVQILDAAGTFNSNNLTVGRNGSKINSSDSDIIVGSQNAIIELIYINSTIGWKAVYSAQAVGAQTITGALSATGDFAIATNKFTVAAATGNVIAAGTLNVAGVTTLAAKLTQKAIAAPVAATGAGGGVAGAAALGAANIVTISSDGATKGVKLLTGAAGDIIKILNTSATAANLFAASGGTINGGSANAGCTVPASKGVLAVCTAADTWTVFDLPAHAGAAA